MVAFDLLPKSLVNQPGMPSGVHNAQNLLVSLQSFHQFIVANDMKLFGLDSLESLIKLDGVGNDLPNTIQAILKALSS
jgi:hypothetical protein